MQVMKVYSPSQTETYIFCPMKRMLSQIYESKRVQGPRDYGRILGDGFTAGMASYNTWRMTAPTPTQCPIGTVDAAVAAAIAQVQSRLSELEGKETIERDEAQRNALIPRVERAVRRAIERDPLPPEWRVQAVELELGEPYGWAKPDLLVVDPRGRAPLDYKFKLSIRGRNADERRYNKDQMIAEWSRSWQMFHYSWAIHLLYGVPVDHYYIALATLEPTFSLELFPFEIHAEDMAQWIAFARQVWHDMEQEDLGLRVPHGQTLCRDVYGPCEFLKACWTHHYDPALMEQDYIVKEKK